MDHSSTRLPELFTRYLQRRCTPAEVEELMGLLQQADAEATLEEPMKALWEEMRDSRVEYSVDWDRMYERVSRTEEDLYMLNRRRTHSFRRAIYQVAAVVLGVAIISGAYWAITRKAPDRKSADDQGIAGVVVGGTPGALSSGGAAVGGASAGVSPAEKRRVLHLPDGSTVILNRHSTLDYPTAFTGATREVRLSGEAYFDITHRQGQPFIVRTGKVTTRVLGTEFNIRAYPNDADIEVTVTHGKVQVMEANKPMGLLTDDQQIRFDKGTEGYMRKKIDTRPVVAWKPQEIRFDDIRMEEAARGIEEKFGVTVRFANPALKDCRVTATFYEDDSLEEIMTVICAVSQSGFVAKDGVITVDGKGCN